MTAAPSSSSHDPGWQAICLCAEWCGVCREWEGLFEALSRSFPQVRFDWVDVEDEADALGELDIETFPTLLVAHGDRACFFGAVEPSSTQVSRLLDRLLADPHARRSESTEGHLLLHRLRSSVLPKR